MVDQKARQCKQFTSLQISHGTVSLWSIILGYYHGRIIILKWYFNLVVLLTAISIVNISKIFARLIIKLS